MSCILISPHHPIFMKKKISTFDILGFGFHSFQPLCDPATLGKSTVKGFSPRELQACLLDYSYCQKNVNKTRAELEVSSGTKRLHEDSVFFGYSWLSSVMPVILQWLSSHQLMFFLLCLELYLQNLLAGQPVTEEAILTPSECTSPPMCAALE